MTTYFRSVTRPLAPETIDSVSAVGANRSQPAYDSDMSYESTRARLVDELTEAQASTRARYGMKSKDKPKADGNNLDSAPTGKRANLSAKNN